MQYKQFLIDPWRHQYQQHQNSHSNLRKFQQFINKANVESSRLEKQTQQLNHNHLREIRDEKSYLSVKDIYRRMKTEDERNKLRTFIPINPLVEAQMHERNKAYLKQQRRLKVSYFNSVIALTQRANFQQPKYIRFINNQRQFYRSPKRKRSQSTNLLSKQQPSLIRRNLTKKQLTSNKSFKDEKGKSFNIGNEEKVKKLKSFFFNTIDRRREKDLSSPSQSKKCEIKLKNMLQKSNKKKKKLEELFKPKYIDQINIQKTLNANKIYRIDTIDSTRTLESPSIAHKTIPKLVSLQSLKKAKQKRKPV